MATNPVKQGLAGPSVILDEAKLGYDHVPDELPFRDDVLHELAVLFRGAAQGRTAQHASLEGPVGTGKTTVARRFATDLREAMRERSVSLEVAYVNCRNDKTDAMSLLSVMRRLDPGFPDRGFSAEEMLDSMRKILARKESHLLIILDEADVLLKGSPKHGTSHLLYHLSRFGAEGGKWHVSVITASQHDVFPLLDEATASSFRRNALVLDPYGAEAMRAIVDQRVKMALQPGTVPDLVAELIADIAAEHGDARRAIQLLLAAGKRVDSDPDRDALTAEDVRGANQKLWSTLPEHKLRELGLHEALTMLAAARRLQKTGEAFAITSEVESTYHLLCELANESPRGHTQFWNYLKNLDKYGFLKVKRSSRGQAGTTQLISLPDAPASSVSEMLAGILSENHGIDV